MTPEQAAALIAALTSISYHVRWVAMLLALIAGVLLASK